MSELPFISGRLFITVLQCYVGGFCVRKLRNAAILRPVLQWPTDIGGSLNTHPRVAGDVQDVHAIAGLHRIISCREQNMTKQTQMEEEINTSRGRKLPRKKSWSNVDIVVSD